MFVANIGIAVSSPSSTREGGREPPRRFMASVRSLGAEVKSDIRRNNGAPRLPEGAARRQRLAPAQRSQAHCATAQPSPYETEPMTAPSRAIPFSLRISTRLAALLLACAGVPAMASEVPMAPGAQERPPLERTTSKGTLLGVEDADGVQVFKGIPYALPPWVSGAGCRRKPHRHGNTSGTRAVSLRSASSSPTLHPACSAAPTVPRARIACT